MQSIVARTEGVMDKQETRPHENPNEKSRHPPRDVGFSCSGGGIRTRDLRVMLTTTAFAADPTNRIVCGLDFLFTLGRTVRGLPLSLYTFPIKGLARDYHATGFPEFDRISRTSFHSRAAQNYLRH